jgi:hypothetical protein
MRGIQLGAAMGARVTSHPARDDWQWADVAVLVKNHGAAFALEAHAHHVPIVWDALDFWRQPGDNRLTESAARALLESHIRLIKPALVIGATRAMAEACDGVYLPHHGWDALVPTDPRPEVATVGYDGNGLYLDTWSGVVAKACAARGWRFVVNPADLSQVDILVALRWGIWDGWICRQWKSGVKLVNAICAGRPVITQESAALREVAPDHSIVETAEDVARALDAWAPFETRRQVVVRARIRAVEFALPTLAQSYRAAVVSVCKERTAA